MAKNTSTTSTTSDAAPAAAENVLTADNGGRYIRRTWTLKGTGNEIPVSLDKATLQVRLASNDTEDAAQAMLNMLALTGGSVRAVVDQFNGSAALDAQKAVKAVLADEGDPKATPPRSAPAKDLDSLQAVLDKHIIEANKRGTGTPGAGTVKAKAERFEKLNDAATQVREELEALRATDPAAAAAQEAVMKRLGLL